MVLVWQAFSHFTYTISNRKLLVCDLQGVLNKDATPPIFEFVDPVIHYKSSRGRVNVYGRTDHGENGIHSFFKTHKCSPLCRAILKTWVKPVVNTDISNIMSDTTTHNTTTATASATTCTRRSPVRDNPQFRIGNQIFDHSDCL